MKDAKIIKEGPGFTVYIFYAPHDYADLGGVFPSMHEAIAYLWERGPCGVADLTVIDNTGVNPRID